MKSHGITFPSFRGNPDYGKMGLVNKNIYLRNIRSMLYIKPYAIALLPKRFPKLLKYCYQNKDTQIEVSVTVALTRTKRQTRITVNTHQVRFN